MAPKSLILWSSKQHAEENTDPFFPLCLVSVAHKVLHAEALPSTNIKHGNDRITSLSVISYSHFLKQVVRLYRLKLSRLSWGSHLPCALWLWLLGVRHIQAAGDMLLPELCCIPPAWKIQPASTGHGRVWVCVCASVCVRERERVCVRGAGEHGITDPPWRCPYPPYTFLKVFFCFPYVVSVYSTFMFFWFESLQIVLETSPKILWSMALYLYLRTRI